MICGDGSDCDNPGCRYGGCQGRRPDRFEGGMPSRNAATAELASSENCKKIISSRRSTDDTARGSGAG
jgi:hypothetical protein